MECKKCGESKPDEYFAKRKNGRPICKVCWNAYMRDWLAKNPRPNKGTKPAHVFDENGLRVCRLCEQGKSDEDFEQVHTKGKVLIRRICRACMPGYQREYRARNKDAINERVRARRRVRGDEINSKIRERYHTDPEHREKKLEYARHAGKRRRDRLRAQVIAGYGGKCGCCGEAEPVFLTLDHVNNDGAELRRTCAYHRTVHRLYRRIIEEGFPSDYQILCANCNHGRYRNGGICPHKTGQDAATSISDAA